MIPEKQTINNEWIKILSSTKISYEKNKYFKILCKDNYFNSELFHKCLVLYVTDNITRCKTLSLNNVQKYVVISILLFRFKIPSIHDTLVKRITTELELQYNITDLHDPDYELLHPEYVLTTDDIFKVVIDRLCREVRYNKGKIYDIRDEHKLNYKYFIDKELAQLYWNKYKNCVIQLYKKYIKLF